MAKIRKIYDEAIKPDGSKQVIYPITSTRAVYTPTNITVDALLSEGYRFGGVVLPTDSPAFTDQRVFYGASVPGIYANFGGISVDGGEAIFLMYDGTQWKKGIFGGAGSNNLTGFKSLASISELPLEETTLGYLIEDDTLPEGFSKQILYVWVGENGDTLGGLYQNCGQLRGASAYETAVRNGYEGTEEEWLNDPVNGIKGNGIQSMSVVGEYSSADSATNTYRITPNVGEPFDFNVKNGTGISTITETPSVANGGTNVIHITKSDGSTYDIEVKNGTASDGFFATEALLTTAIPSPNVGDYAFVSKAADGTFPAYIYVCETAGTWTNSEQEFTTEVAQVSVSQNTLSIGSEEAGELAGQLIENPEWVKVVTDREDKILYGIKTDGKFYFGADCPPQVQEYVQSQLDIHNIDDIETFLGTLIKGDTLSTLLNGKVDKETGKSLIDADFASSQSAIENPEYLKVITDLDGRVIEGIQKNGSKEINTPITLQPAIIGSSDNPEWMRIITDNEERIIAGIKSDGSFDWAKGIPTPLKDYTNNTIELLNKEGYYPLVEGDFTDKLTRTELINLYNSKLLNFSKICKCNLSSFYELFGYNTDEEIIWKINHNFREEVVAPWMDKKIFASQLNKYFNIPIYRFDDAKINNTDKADCSLRVLFNSSAVSRVNVDGYTDNSFQCIYTGTQNAPITIDGDNVTINNGWMAIDYNSSYPLYVSGGNYNSGYTNLHEPSSLISDDGQKIELFGQTAYTESEDGVNWSEAVEFVLPEGHKVHSHSSVNKVDGIYMMVGATANEEATPGNPVYMDLWTSTDKINWQWRGHLISTNDDIGSGETLAVMGNSYLFKDNGGTYYLYYEGARVTPWWETCLMTCTDLFYDRGNGFIGNWQQYADNPIFPFNYNDRLTGVTSAFCNPEFVKGQDNQPLKINGRYYMYYLNGYRKQGITQATINRMYSYDLIHWVEEGVIFDNRDIADGGEEKGDNGDQSLCEFKGKTYLFYTQNINSYGYSESNIRYTIDDRPQIEILKIKP